MKKQTAVEWLVNEIDPNLLVTEKVKLAVEQAKAMEKEQIMDANSCGFSDGINHEKDIPVNFISCEQYYNETFNQ